MKHIIHCFTTERRNEIDLYDLNLSVTYGDYLSSVYFANAKIFQACKVKWNLTGILYSRERLKKVSATVIRAAEAALREIFML